MMSAIISILALILSITMLVFVCRMFVRANIDIINLLEYNLNEAELYSRSFQSEADMKIIADLRTSLRRINKLTKIEKVIGLDWIWKVKS